MTQNTDTTVQDTVTQVADHQRYGIIYCATHLESQRKYIGQTIGSLKDRRQGHKDDARRFEHSGYFHKAIRKYTIEAFVFEQIDQASCKQELDEKERY